jgi:hypothetical protein
MPKHETPFELAYHAIRKAIEESPPNSRERAELHNALNCLTAPVLPT